MAQRATQSGGDCDNSQVFAWAENGNSDEIYSWLENGGNVHVMDEYSSIPLHLASLCGHADIVQALVEYNSDVNCRNLNLVNRNDTHDQDRNVNENVNRNVSRAPNFRYTTLLLNKMKGNDNISKKMKG